LKTDPYMVGAVSTLGIAARMSMDDLKSILNSLEIEVREIESRYRECFEQVFKSDYERSKPGLRGIARKTLSNALGPDGRSLDDEDSQHMLDAARVLERRAGKSLSKRSLLAHLAIGFVCADNVMHVAEDGNLAKAISALAAAAMASGAVQSAAMEFAPKSDNGKRTADMRKDVHTHRREEALALWRAKISPKLSAALAAEKLRGMGVAISHDKLSRLISAEKHKGSSQVQEPLFGVDNVRRLKPV
jgi:hypothetical protein